MTMKTFRVETKTTKVVSTFVELRAHSIDEAISEAKSGHGAPSSKFAESAVEMGKDFDAVDVDEEAEQELFSERRWG